MVLVGKCTYNSIQLYIYLNVSFFSICARETPKSNIYATFPDICHFTSSQVELHCSEVEDDEAMIQDVPFSVWDSGTEANFEAFKSHFSILYMYM